MPAELVKLTPPSARQCTSSGIAGAAITRYGDDTTGRLSRLTHDLPAANHNNRWTFASNLAGQIVQTNRSTLRQAQDNRAVCVGRALQRQSQLHRQWH